MHILQPKHTKLNQSEIDTLLNELNISLAQLPKIKITDSAIPDNCEISDIIKIDRVINGKKFTYYRVITV
jgi:DNA-directed RNA polymerase subunit H